jgi:nucleoside-diphosphate-sugar epimerase
MEPVASATHRVVLTGASGALGRNFLELVGHRPDFQTLALLRHESRPMGSRPSVEVARVDSFDRPKVGALISQFRPTAIVHCAATGMTFPRTEWFELIRFNVDLTVNLCECAATMPGCQFVFVSTGLAYRPEGRPLQEDDTLDTLHPYGASKAAADLLVRSAAAEFAVPLTVLRPFSFTGLGDDRTRLFSQILRAAQDGGELALSAGTQVRDHCSARDVAAGIVRALETGHGDHAAARVYNLGGGRDEPLRVVIEDVLAQLGLAVPLKFGGRPLGRFEPPHLVADIHRAGRELDWRPRHNLAHAVWQLARETFPGVTVREPAEFI